ncbi:MAG: glycoside hydrolase family 127 protein [Thermomicrobiales bacterium]|nr:glycoside hydrolase family 127 protein [Thermomicrobiales bacterium]MCO5224286.1 glycoside hydrolase family 127 protein [Thermomicrobiales bacterium]MCO5229009.1 glycoside hydrolase family 127 protein [Thermomicrobiales bacterium]
MNNAMSVILRDTERSRAAHACVPVEGVRLRGGHLAARMATNRRITIPSQYERLVAAGAVKNFALAAGLDVGEHQGFGFADSDVYKWMEAASWSLVTVPDENLKEQLDHLIELVAAAQMEDGYLNTWYQLHPGSARFSNMRDDHELYCAGHLMQAAIANHRCTGDTVLLNVAIRFADLLTISFGPGLIEQPCGHPEIELALIELSRETGRDAYLDLARYFLDIRGYGAIGGGDIYQDDTPLREQREMVGHAVRAVYLNAGAADLVHERIDAELRRALFLMSANMLERKSYVTGGIGSRYEGEAFGLDYELPNNRAYAESCAAIGAVMWLWRMMLLENKDDSYLADAIERIIYNAVLPGISLGGDEYFYQNPLRDEDGSLRRQPWFECACCPSNIARFIAQLPGYFASVTSQRYGESDARHDQIWIHQYADADLSIPTLGGGVVHASMTTRYPWDGEITLEITGLEGAAAFTLQMRVPDWAFNATATLNGERLPDAEAAPGQYLTIARQWEVGDIVTLSIPMPVRRIVAHPRVANNAGRMVLMRGPLVYCIEETDNEIGDVRDIVLPHDVLVTAAHRPEMLGGITVLSTHALLESPAPGWNRALYRNVDLKTSDASGMSEVQIHAVPYMVWANRGAGPMTVWLRHR